MVKFIVLSTQRSGSSFLGSLLDSHPAIRCMEELFMPKNKNAITYRSWWRRSFRRRIGHLLNRRRSIDFYLEGIFTEPAASGGHGFKLMYEQAQRYPAVVDWCRRHQVKIVHMIRGNSLKVIVSREIARKRGVYLSTRPVSATTVTLDTRKLSADLQRVNSLVDRNRESFSSFPYTEVLYEDLLARQGDECRRILSFLHCDTDVRLTSDLIKTSSDSLTALIGNYDDVRQALAGTPYEMYLDGGSAARD